MMPITGTSKVDISTGAVSVEYDMESLKMTPTEEKEYIEHEILYAMMLADVRGGLPLS